MSNEQEVKNPENNENAQRADALAKVPNQPVPESSGVGRPQLEP